MSRTPPSFPCPGYYEGTAVSKKFKIGDHVLWNSEAGRVSGIIIKKITSDTKFKGYTHHASREAPQYFIKSDKTDHVAIHKGTALRLIPARARSGKAKGKKKK
jgi:Hypervirulence associated proteins TUDOR domain